MSEVPSPSLSRKGPPNREPNGVGRLIRVALQEAIEQHSLASFCRRSCGTRAKAAGHDRAKLDGHLSFLVHAAHPSHFLAVA
jgi:hypothetical protein